MIKKECPECFGTRQGELINWCGDFECCDPIYADCEKCDGDGEIEEKLMDEEEINNDHKNN